MLMVSQELSAKMRNMSFVCALLVVLFHDCQDLQGFWWDVKMTLSSVAVPYFFFASGFWGVGHADEQGWFKWAIRKRIKSLLIPFFAWAMLYAIAFAPISICADVIAGRAFGTSIPALNGGLARVLGLKLDEYPMTIPLWYLRTLFLYVLLLPALVWCLKYYKMFLLGMLFVMACLASRIINPTAGGWLGFVSCTLYPLGFFYFACGVYMRLMTGGGGTAIGASEPLVERDLCGGSLRGCGIDREENKCRQPILFSRFNAGFVGLDLVFDPIGVLACMACKRGNACLPASLYGWGMAQIRYSVSPLAGRMPICYYILDSSNGFNMCCNPAASTACQGFECPFRRPMK